MARELVNHSVDQSPVGEVDINRVLVSKLVDLLIYIPEQYVTEELVNFIFGHLTKTNGSYKFLLQYIDKNPVFLVPTIWRLRNVSKQYIYGQIKELQKRKIY